MNEKAKSNKEKMMCHKMLVVLIVFAVISILMSGILIMLPKLKEKQIELAKEKTNNIKQNYTTQELSENQWDISATENDHVIATLSEDGILTISGTGNMKDCNGPSSTPWNNVKNNIKIINIEDGVTNIGSYMFSGCNSLTSIDIPQGVNSIGGFAFYYCEKLKDLNIPEGVISIKYDAFSYCQGLTDIAIPSTVTDIGLSVFTGCNSLENIKVSTNNLNYKDDQGVLYTKDGTKIIKYPSAKKDTEYSILEEVTDIENNAFSKCNNLVSINIPKEVTQIGYDAFYGCNKITSINIPENVTNIGSEAFGYCKSLTSINVNENNPNYKDDEGVLYTKDGINILQYPNAKEKEEYTILNGVINIKYGAFSYCSKLIKIEIPDSVTNIDSHSFYNCTNLTNINIPEGVSIIETCTFEGCSSLVDVTMPNTITTLKPYAFRNCTNLTNIQLLNGITQINGYVFYNCTSLTSIKIPSSVIEIGENVFYGCSNLSSIDVDENNNYYSSIDGVLFNKEGTTLVKYPDNKGTIYTTPENTIEIAPYAFAGNIRFLELSSNVTTIAENSIYDFTCKFVDIRIPDSTTQISIKKNSHAKITIYCNKDSYAETYAKENNILIMPYEEFQLTKTIKNIQFEDVNLYNKIINGGIAHNFPGTGSTMPMSQYILNNNDETRTIDMYIGDINCINSLDIRGSNVESIKGIDNFTNLEKIWASNNFIKDISPISNLTNLYTVDFEKNKISDISPLENSKNLTTIYLAENFRISDISVLQNCNNLKELDLTDNLVENISAITNITSLQELYLGINSISNIENIGNLVNLKILVLSNNAIEDISELSNLTQLEELYLGYKTITPRYNFRKIENHIVGNLIKDITPLNNLTNLKVLGLENNKIEDVSSIKDLNVEKIYIGKQELKIQKNKKEVVQVELPNIFIEAKDPNSIFYTDQDYSLTNCTLNEDGRSVIINTSEIDNDVISITIHGGLLDKSLCIIELEENSEEEIDIEFDIKGYVIKDNYIRKIAPNTLISEFIKSIQTNTDYVIKEANEEVESTGIMKTGQTIIVGDKTYTIIVIGDLNKDGKIDVSELARIAKIGAGKVIDMTEIEKMAIDVDMDGEIKINDLAAISKYAAE